MKHALATILTLIAWGTVDMPAHADSGLARANIEVTTLREGLNTQLIIGNGDLMAFIEETDEGLIIGTSKNDVWDLRLDTSNDAPLVPVRDIERIALHGADGKPPAEALRELYDTHTQGDSYHAHPYPSPRMTARWRIPLDGGPPMQDLLVKCLRLLLGLDAELDAQCSLAAFVLLQGFVPALFVLKQGHDHSVHVLAQRIEVQ